MITSKRSFDTRYASPVASVVMKYTDRIISRRYLEHTILIAYSVPENNILLVYPVPGNNILF